MGRPRFRWFETETWETQKNTAHVGPEQATDQEVEGPSLKGHEMEGSSITVPFQGIPQPGAMFE